MDNIPIGLIKVSTELAKKCLTEPGGMEAKGDNLYLYIQFCLSILK